MEPLIVFPMLFWAAIPYVLAIYGLVLLVRMGRTQEQILRKLESVEHVVRQR